MLINKSIHSDSQGNALRLSRVLQTEQEVKFHHFSAKFVVSGNEIYTLNNRRFVVKAGEYIIGNTSATSSVLINNSIPVDGICIDISKDMISEIMDYHFEKPNKFSRFLFEQEWVSQKYNSNNTTLGYALQQIAHEFDSLNNGTSQISRELFYTIAECIVKDQSAIYHSFDRLNAVKEDTNGRLFNFVCDAKNFMDDHYLNKISVQTMAREAALSEYHFIRLFKTIFKTTPYKYIHIKKLDLAFELLKNHYSISDISVILGYNDVAAFSNAFKHHFGMSPKNIKIN